MDPKNEMGEDGLHPMPNRVSVDNQTDINSSAYAEGVQSDIAKGDEKLGKEISDLDSNVQDSLEGMDSDIAANTKAIEDATIAGYDARKQIIDTVTFNAGDEKSELTPERLQELITEFKEAMEENIEIIKNDNSSEKEIRIATFWISQFGEVYTPLGFSLWQLKDFSSVADDLDAATMEEYQNVIEEMRNEIDTILKSIGEFESMGDLTEEDKKELAELKKVLKSIEGNFIRWTDPSDATPDVTVDRVATLEKGLQWRFDVDDNAMEEFKTTLHRDVLGTSSAGKYYKHMEDHFNAAAEDAEVTIEQYEEAVKNGEEISQDLKLEKAKADYFKNNFGFIPSIIAITSFEDYNDSYKSVQWDENTYNQYLEEVSAYINIRAKFQSELDSELSKPTDSQDDDLIKQLQQELKDVKSRLSSITCDSGLNPNLECLDGYVYWYVTKHDNEMDEFTSTLHRDVLGTSSAGEYYKHMEDDFNAAAEDAQVAIEQYEEAVKNGEEISQDIKVEKAKADYFKDSFGFTPSIIAITSFEDYKDGFNAVQWDENTYNGYLSSIFNFKEVAQTTQSELDSELSKPTDSQDDDLIKKLQQTLKVVKEEIRRYTCEDAIEGDVECLDGYIAWYVHTHDTDFKQYIAESREENGFNPSASVDYLESKKNDFQSEMEDALDILEQSTSEEGGVFTPSDLDAANDFVQRFGRVANSQTAFHNWLAYKAEGRVSETVGEIFKVIDCVIGDLTQDVNEIVTTSTEVASYFPLPDGQTSEFRIYGAPKSYKVLHVFVNGIVTPVQHLDGSNVITFGVAPHAGSSLTIFMEVRSTQNITSPVVDECSFELPSELLSYDSYGCDEITRVLDKLNMELNSIDSVLNDTLSSITESETTKIELEELESKVADAQKQYQAELTIAQDDKSTTVANQAKSEKDAEEVSQQVKDVQSKLNDDEGELNNRYRKQSEMKTDVKIQSLAYDVENARPFPDEDKLKELEADIARLDKDIADNENAITALEADITKKKTEISDLTIVLDQLNNDIFDMEREIEKIQSTIVTTSILLKLAMSNSLLVVGKISETNDTLVNLQNVLAEFEVTKADLYKKVEDLVAKRKENCSDDRAEA